MQDDLDLALELVDCTYTSPQGAPDGKTPDVKKLFDAITAPQFGKLYSFGDNEQKQLSGLQDLIQRYVEQRTPSRPLCLAVFGPPGSGKSFAVKQVKAKIEPELTAQNSKLKLPMTTLNLTQISDSGEMARPLARLAGEQDSDTVPIVFFDEFDTARGGARYGWLSWFLAPMNDGEIFYDGAIMKLKRAIYVFAGGTAYTFEGFSERRDDERFRAAKGPDFVSRLHGYLDVEGPNTDPKALRRALILRDALGNRAKALKERSSFRPDRELLEAMLRVGRYRHGARSITAVVEMLDVSDSKPTFKHLPPDYLMAPHTDRGPLDRDRIGGCIALSGYGHDDDTKKKLDEVFPEIASKLWDAGATIAYGGRWNEPDAVDGQSLLQALGNKSKNLPRALRRKPDKNPYLVCFKPESGVAGKHEYVETIARKDAAKEPELKAAYPDENERVWVMNVLNRFARRLRITEMAVARIAIAGAANRGRFPGIAEEVMLTLALEKPVYVVGAFGGAAAEVGALLGLSRPWKGLKPDSLSVSEAGRERMELLSHVEDRLRPPPWSNLPTTTENLIKFFQEHALGGDKWPNNGLSPEENRELFLMKDSEKIVNRVRLGLERLFSRG